jgi:hypothetical protein
MSQHGIKAEDDRVRSITKVAAISAVGSLLFLAGLQPAVAQQPRGDVCGEAGRYNVTSSSTDIAHVEVLGGGDASGFSALACGNGSVARGGGTITVGGFAGFNSNDLRNSNNIFVGLNSGQQVVGASNIAVGGETGSTVGGGDNVALGTRAGSQVTGNANVAIGLNTNPQ